MRERSELRERGYPRPPLELAQPTADAFPSTALTTLLGQLQRGDPSVHSELRARIMSRYAEPLAVYAGGSSLRAIAEPRELVNGFFAHALSRTDFFTRYQSSGMRLRRWLMNGLLLHARGVIRDRVRHQRREGSPLESAADRAAADRSAEAAYNHSWALALLSEACASVEASLVAEGRDRAWMVFRRHALDGRSYIDLETEFGLGRQQMADLVRAVTKRLRARIAELLAHEGDDAQDGLIEIIRLVS